MRPRFSLNSLLLFSFLLLGGTALRSQAESIPKANNTDALDSPSSWVGGVVPGTGDLAVFGADNTAASSPVTIGNGVEFLGILFTGSPGANLVVNAGTGGALTLGADGIDASAMTTWRSFTINSSVVLAADQTWKLPVNSSTNPGILAIPGVISGAAILTVDGLPGNDGEHAYLQGANTFSGGFVLAQNGAVRVGAASATFADGAVTSGAFGTGPVTIQGGILFGNSGLSGSSDTTIQSDFAINRGAAGGVNSRLRLFGGFDMAGDLRTVSLGRHSSDASAVLASGGESVRFEAPAGAPPTVFSNGRLRFVRDILGGPDDYATVRFESGSGIFPDDGGLVIGTNVITVLGSSFVFSTFGERPDIEVEEGGILNLSDATNARDAFIEGLSGNGIVTSLASNASGLSTLTIQPGSLSTFAGRLLDGTDMSSLVPAAAASVSLVINGSGTQVLAGDNSYSGSTTVTSGTLSLSAGSGSAAGDTSSVSVEADGVLLLAQPNQIGDTTPITLSGGELRVAAGANETVGALTVTAPSTIALDAGSGTTLAFGAYTPTQLLTIQNLGGNTLTFPSDLSSAVTDPALFAFPDGYSASWDAGTGIFTIAEPAPNLTTGTTITGDTPQLLGYNMGTFWEGSNTPDWWRYSGVNAARMFLHPNHLPLQGTDAVATSSDFLTEKAALQADPLASTRIDWADLELRFANNNVVSGGVNARYQIDPTIGTLHQMGLDMLLQVSASENFLPITDADDWGGKWQLWKHYYAMAFHLARHFDVHRYQMFNEPDHPNAGGLLPENWLMRLQLVRDAVDSAIADVNLLYGKSLVPMIYAPTTSSSNVDAAWGGFALENIDTDFLGQTPSGFRLFDRYNYHQYNSDPATFGSKVVDNKNAVATALAGSPTLPLAISEWNVHTSAEFELRPTETLDTPAKYSRFGAIAAELASNGLEEMFVFKFTQTARGANPSGVVKNGMHHTDWDIAPYNHGGITQAGEVYRLFNRAAAPGGKLVSFSATGEAADLDLMVVHQPAQGRYFVFSVNDQTTAKTIRIDCSAWNLPEGAFATVQEVGSASNGGVVAVERFSGGRLPARLQAANSVLLYTIETESAQEQVLDVSADTTLVDGNNVDNNYGQDSTVRARNDGNTISFRNVAALRFSLPLVYWADVLQAVLVLPAASDGTSEPIHAHVYGMADDDWNENTVTWSTVPTLRQGVGPGALIRHNVVDNTTNGSASIEGQILTAGTEVVDSMVDVTGFVHERLDGGAASFLVAQDARWDENILTQTAGDAQPGGITLISREASTAEQPASRLVLIRRVDTDNDGLSDAAEANEFGTSTTLVDTDRDGLSDGEEILAHGTNPLSTDTDGDGQSDRAEILLGSNPLSAASVWSAHGVMASGGFTIEWTGSNEFAFEVKRTLDLKEGWTTIHSVDGINGPMSHTIPGPLSGKAFYRVEAH